ncbi:hypothetical protein COLO4_14292 [Corchorus olitorius]|uniref:F-box domain-containing protein n=1 Tax=Corchorus olitorius TaxID=93759 RepID=A0A1R3JSR6_9ROSI|nr:hypothetical protein COLO4_14292 [Corchorus olitorius]
MQYHLRDRNRAALLSCVQNRRLDHTRDATRLKYSQDRISSLPEDIVANILSRLTMKEAMRTSILSSKWRLFWTHFSGSLDFDASPLIFKIHNKLVREPTEAKRMDFVNWVNRTLECIQSPTIEGFRVGFDVKSKPDLDSWISFAVSKRAKSLELDLTKIELSSNLFGRFLFPAHLISGPSIACLSSLCLKNVDVTEEALDSILTHCTSLEVLRVHDAVALKRFRISDPSISLKCLELTRCNCLEDVEISGVNLVSFKFIGLEVDIRYTNVPRLAKLSFGALYLNQVIYQRLEQVIRFRLQLETLILDVNSDWMADVFPKYIPEFTNLKHFELGSSIGAEDHSLLPFTSLLKASPLLQKFTLKALFRWAPNPPPYTEFANHLSEHVYPCLEVVEFKGFMGFPAEIQILFHLLENAPALEKVTIDACRPRYLGSTLEPIARELEECQNARLRAVELQQKIPPGIDFMVI